MTASEMHSDINPGARIMESIGTEREATPQELQQRRRLEVFLVAVGNPDFGQDPTRPPYGVTSKEICVQTLEEASITCRQYIVENDLGGGNWPGAKVHDADTGALVGRISYNGRVWMRGAPL